MLTFATGIIWLLDTLFFAKRRNLAKKYLKGQIKIPSKNGDAPPPEAGQRPRPQ